MILTHLVFFKFWSGASVNAAAPEEPTPEAPIVITDWDVYAGPDGEHRRKRRKRLELLLLLIE